MKERCTYVYLLSKEDKALEVLEAEIENYE